MNKVCLSGRISSKKELTKTTNGFSILEINIAVSDNEKVKGTYQEVTEFIPVKILGNNADYINNYADKGDLIELSGKIKIDTWKDKNGNNRSKMYVLASDVKIMSKKSKNGVNNEKSYQENSSYQQNNYEYDDKIDEDKIPF